MNKLTKISLLAMGAAMVTQALQAQTATGISTANDLILGFTSQAPGVTQDYVLDLGAVPTSSNVQLGGISLSTFNTVFGSAATAGTVNVGVIGGGTDPNSGNSQIFTTTLRSGALATTAGAGTETAPYKASGNPISQASNYGSSLALGNVAQSASASWSSSITTGPGVGTIGTAQNSFTGYLPHTSGHTDNPMVTLPGSETVTLDIWNDIANNTGANTWTYVGDLQLDLSGSTLNATFDPTVTSVPEPSTYGLMAGFGLLALGFRHQFSRKNA